MEVKDKFDDNEIWISTGTTVNSAPHKQVVELGIKRNFEAASCAQEIIEKMSIGHGLKKKMCTDDRT